MTSKPLNFSMNNIGRLIERKKYIYMYIFHAYICKLSIENKHAALPLI